MSTATPGSESPKSRYIASPATMIAVCAVALTTLGLVILFSASAAFKQGPYAYLNKQLLGVVVAVGAAWFVTKLDLENLRQHVWKIGILAVVCLILVRIPHIGTSVKGSWRWLGVGPVRLQVSELAKLAMVFCLSHYLALNQTRINEFKRGFAYPLAIVGGFAGLIMIEPDFGTAALTMAVGLTLLFFAGAKWRYILPTIAGVAVLFAVAVIHNPNRLRRFTAFLDVEANKQSGTYQLYQALAAFAAGGTDGAGLGQGRQQHKFLPEAHTDFIFAVVGEELGLFFTIGVVIIFGLLFFFGMRHMRKAPNLFQYLLVAGSLMLICLQAIINLGVVTGVFPTKGMSLPFISAGLSNLLLMGLLVGIFINTERTWGRAALPDLGRSFKDLS